MTANNWKHRIEDITRDGSPDQLLTKYEVAELLRIAPVTVTRMGAAGKIPRVRLNAKNVRYKLSDVREYIREMTEL